MITAKEAYERTKESPTLRDLYTMIQWACGLRKLEVRLAAQDGHIPSISREALAEASVELRKQGFKCAFDKDHSVTYLTISWNKSVEAFIKEFDKAVIQPNDHPAVRALTEEEQFKFNRASVCPIEEYVLQHELHRVKEAVNAMTSDRFGRCVGKPFVLHKEVAVGLQQFLAGTKYFSFVHITKITQAESLVKAFNAMYFKASIQCNTASDLYSVIVTL